MTSAENAAGMSIALDERWLWARVLCRSPLVTFSLSSRKTPAGVASVASDLFKDRPALHLLHHAWTLEHGEATEVAHGIHRARAQHPDSQYLMLASNDAEVLDCAAAGVPAIVGSGLIMIDERIFRPRISGSRTATYDAVYNARLDPFKRHQLAAAIDKLLLIYAPMTSDAPAAALLESTRRVLPHATFANNPKSASAYEMLDNSQVADLMSQARVGLCLSAVEGCMRASMEYLLCGLPVVSTRSTGGRDRFFGTTYCRIVNQDDPEEIASAVRELGSRNLDPMRIRDHVGQMVAFDRYNLLLGLNAHVRKLFGLKQDLFPSIEPFLGAVSRYQPATAVRNGLEVELVKPSM